MTFTCNAPTVGHMGCTRAGGCMKYKLDLVLPKHVRKDEAAAVCAALVKMDLQIHGDKGVTMEVL